MIKCWKSSKRKLYILYYTYVSLLKEFTNWLFFCNDHARHSLSLSLPHKRSITNPSGNLFSNYCGIMDVEHPVYVIYSRNHRHTHWIIDGIVISTHRVSYIYIIVQWNQCTIHHLICVGTSRAVPILIDCPFIISSILLKDSCGAFDLTERRSILLLFLELR